MDIPADLLRYLAKPENRHARFTQGEIREITFRSPDDLVEATFDVSTSDFALQEKWESDPELRFEFDGIDLIKECNSYSPKGILVWFPCMQLYGTWDCDHHKIMIFPHAKWSDIRRELRRYVNAQWYPNAAPLAEYLRPWE